MIASTSSSGIFIKLKMLDIPPPSPFWNFFSKTIHATCAKVPMCQTMVGKTPSITPSIKSDFTIKHSTHSATREDSCEPPPFSSSTSSSMTIFFNVLLSSALLCLTASNSIFSIFPEQDHSAHYSPSPYPPSLIYQLLMQNFDDSWTDCRFSCFGLLYCYYRWISGMV